MVKITFWDKIIIALVFALSVTGFIANFTLESSATQLYAVVHIDNEQVAEFSFSPDDETQHSIPFGPNNEHEAVLEVKDGRVRMLPMSTDLCPRGICSHTGWIEKGYETIVCVPNRIVVSFQEGAPDSYNGDLDGVTY